MDTEVLGLNRKEPAKVSAEKAVDVVPSNQAVAPQPAGLKVCPYCAEYDLQPEAIVCKHCGRYVATAGSEAQLRYVGSLILKSAERPLPSGIMFRGVCDDPEVVKNHDVWSGAMPSGTVGVERKEIRGLQ